MTTNTTAFDDQADPMPPPPVLLNPQGVPVAALGIKPDELTQARARIAELEAAAAKHTEFVEQVQADRVSVAAPIVKAKSLLNSLKWKAHGDEVVFNKGKLFHEDGNTYTGIKCDDESFAEVAEKIHNEAVDRAYAYGGRDNDQSHNETMQAMTANLVAALKERDEARAQIEVEKKRRVYYQDLVYQVCNWIDVQSDNEKPIVAGTFEAPSTEIQHALARFGNARADESRAIEAIIQAVLDRANDPYSGDVLKNVLSQIQARREGGESC